jgi:hypothetical protein
MKASYRNTMAKYRSALRAMIGLTLLLPVLGTSCNNAQCESLRDELTSTKRRWARCTTHTDCIKIGGSSGDCTGIMTCDFAVNRSFRLEAERRIASLPEETVDCTQCTSANCVAGDIAWCEPRSGQCIVVTEILDAGQTPSEGGASNSGAPAGD